MMKNTLILLTDKLVARYLDCMSEHLWDTQDELHPAEFANELIQFGTTLKNLSSSNNDTALNTFRQEFGAGFTMMMVNDEEFNQLEAWSRSKEEFRVALFREDGSAVGIVTDKFLNW
jgi:hypothetical protein